MIDPKIKVMIDPLKELEDLKFKRDFKASACIGSMRAYQVILAASPTPDQIAFIAANMEAVLAEFDAATKAIADFLKL